MNPQRALVVAEARTWKGTPYHHEGRVRGVGCDCAMLILESFTGSGVVEHTPPVRPYTHDWHMHRSEERYLEVVEQHLTQIGDSEESLEARLAQDPGFSVEPGDVLVWRIGRTFSHGAIVSAWPNIVHAYFPSQMVEEEDLNKIRALVTRPMRVYTFWR